MANADRTQIQIGKEGVNGSTGFGVAPTSAFELVRFTSESLTRETNTTTSAIIRSDRNVEDVIRTSISSSCELVMEMELPATGKVTRQLISAAVGHSADDGTAYGTMSTRTTSGSIVIDGDTWDTATPASNEPQHGFHATTGTPFSETAWTTTGNWFRVLPISTSCPTHDSTKLSGGGYFRIHANDSTQTNGNDRIDVEGSQILTDFTATAGTIFQPASRLMDNGVTEKSFAMEKQHLDVTTDIMNGLGMTVDSWTVSVSPENIITQTFSMQGQNSSQQAALTTGSQVAASTGEILNAVDHVAGVYASLGPNDSDDGNFPDKRLRPLDGVTSFELTISNGLRARSQVGLLGPKSFGQAAIAVSGTLSVYYDAASSDIIEKLYEGFEDGHLAIVLEEADTQALTIADSSVSETTKALCIDMPRVKFTGATRHATGTGTDVMAELNFTAFYDNDSAETVCLHWWDD